MSESPMQFKTIVVGTDGSEGAARAMEWAARLAESTGAEVRAVNVLTYSHEFMRDITFDTVTTWRRSLEKELKSKWVAPLVERGIPYRCLVVEQDSPALGLVKAADKEGADLIVVGTRGSSRLGGRMLGSTSYSLAHHAHCPVTVVPPAAESDPTA
ncbi:MAG: universal stress protein [Acidimicrobiales bacterium]|nr:universal stress protein [Acidimicrobiales bacterium]